MASKIKSAFSRFIRKFNVQEASDRGAIEYLLVLGVHGDQLEAIEGLGEDELLGDFNKTTTRAIIPYMNIKNDPEARKILDAYINYFEEYQKVVEWRQQLENQIGVPGNPGGSSLTAIRKNKILGDIEDIKEFETKLVRRLKTLSKIVLGDAFEKIDPNKTIVLNKPQLIVPIGGQKIPVPTGTPPLIGDRREVP